MTVAQGYTPPKTVKTQQKGPDWLVGELGDLAHLEVERKKRSTKTK